MAEFSRRAGRRILESIDTRKASKQEVYEFYQRQRKQLKSKGGQVGKALKLGEVKKSELVKELEKLESVQSSVRAAQKEEQTKRYTSKYEQTKREMERASVWEAKKQYEKFQKSLKAAASRGDINLKTFIGGAFKEITSKKKSQKAMKDYEERASRAEAPQRRAESRKGLKRSSSVFKGRLAHDLVSKWVDDMLLDPDTFDDSESIWAAMETVDENPTDFNFFKENYTGEEKEGSQAYYEEFQEFLDDIPKFEAALAAAGEQIPPYPSSEYWNRLVEWRRSRYSL